MTKNELLKTITEEQIIKHYLPDFSPAIRRNYTSPFSEKDDHPSLSFYQENQRWKFKSHNTGHQGDVFQFVADIKHIDCKRSFNELIDLIAQDLNLNGFATVVTKKRSISISYEAAPSVQMLKYFDQFQIDLETLIRFDVRQIKFHHFVTETGRDCRFDYRKLNKLAVCYIIHNRLKTYFPAIQGMQEKAFGYKNQTSDDVFGFRQLAEAHHKFIVVAAGEKDALALNAAGISAVSLQSENVIPKPTQINGLKAIADQVIIAYDNDEAGKAAAQKLATLTGWRVFEIPSEKDVSDFILKNGRQPLLDALEAFVQMPPPPAPPAVRPDDEDGDEQIFTIFHQAERYLNKHYVLRFNTIKLELEGKKKDAQIWEPVNENDLFVEMNKAGIKIGMDKLIAILKSNYVTRFNPIRDYFETLPAWDKQTDHITALANYLNAFDQVELQMQFAKWLIRSVRCAMEDGYYNKQAFILVHPKQNSGKTSFCRFLCPPQLKDYMAENISDDKDSRIAIAKNFLINLDELSSLAKHEINSLKALFSKDVINERLPYDRKNSIIHRVASFIGSTNMAEFLADETGSVRWLCFEIKSIDWSYREKVNIHNVWAQAFAYYKEGYDSEMTREDIESNERRNSKFQQLSAEAEIIPNYILPATENTAGAVFLSATEVLVYIQSFAPSLRLNKIAIGRAMPVCGFSRTKDASIDRYGYWVTKLR